MDKKLYSAHISILGRVVLIAYCIPLELSFCMVSQNFVVNYIHFKSFSHVLLHFYIFSRQFWLCTQFVTINVYICTFNRFHVSDMKSDLKPFANAL